MRNKTRLVWKEWTKREETELKSETKEGNETHLETTRIRCGRS